MAILARNPDYIGDLAGIPFAPGTSPFHIRGSLYRASFEREEKKPHGLRKALASLSDPTLREFFEQQFQVASWYDVFPLIAINLRRARVVGMPFNVLQFTLSRELAEHELAGANKLLLTLVSVESLTMRIATFNNYYFDYGTFTSQIDGACKISGTRKGIPRATLGWHCASMQGFLQCVLEKAGMKDPRLAYVPEVSSGTQDGVEMVDISFSFTWRSASCDQS